jgi:hypothetical protein
MDLHMPPLTRPTARRDIRECAVADSNQRHHRPAVWLIVALALAGATIVLRLFLPAANRNVAKLRSGQM